MTIIPETPGWGTEPCFFYLQSTNRLILILAPPEEPVIMNLNHATRDTFERLHLFFSLE